MSLATKLAATAFLISVTQAQAGSVVIKDSHFTYSGISYFRCGSEEVRLGSFGEKKTPLTKCNYLSVEDHITSSNLTKISVSQSGPYDIDWEHTSEGDIAANFNWAYFGIAAKTALTGSYSKFKSADVKLVKFSITESNMKTLLNSYASTARTYLKSEGSDGRVVPAIWVAMDAELAGQFSGGASLSVTSEDGDVGIIATGSSGSSYTIVIAPGTTFAYLLEKVKDWNSGKTKINDLEDDQWSTD